jgi:hypothetical protein
MITYCNVAIFVLSVSGVATGRFKARATHAALDALMCSQAPLCGRRKGLTHSE